MGDEEQQFFEGDQGGGEYTEEIGEGGGGGPGPLGKIENALCMMCLGMVLFPCSLFLLGWNEKAYVCANNSIIYSEENAKEVGCQPTGTEEGFGFFACPIQESSLQTFYPCMFNVDSQMSCTDASPAQLSLSKVLAFKSTAGQQLVEMVQCQETCEENTKKNSAGKTVKTRTCRYAPEWSTTEISSAGWNIQQAEIGCPGLINGQNPAFPTNFDKGTSTDYAPGPIKAGATNLTAWTINSELIRQMSPTKPVPLSTIVPPNTVHGTGTPNPATRPLSLDKNNVMVDGDYLTTCAGTGAVGCVRLSYHMALSAGESPSVLAGIESGGVTVPQEIPSSWGCSASNQQWIRNEPSGGPQTKDDLIEALKGENSMRTWFLRIAGVIMAWLSVFCCFQPIAAAADIIGDCLNFIPCVGGFLEDFLEGAVSALLCALSCGIGCSCGLFVISVMWVVMRPMVGIPLLLLSCCCFAGGCGVYTSMHEKKGKKNRPPASEEESADE